MACQTIDEAKGWEQIEEQITCLLCGGYYTEPKTLSCLHTFCKGCLEERQAKDIASKRCCPLCLDPFPPDGIASIHTNLTINCLIKLFNRREEKVQALIDLNCGLCTERYAPVMMWCVDCKKALCGDCHEAHVKCQQFKHHKSVTVKDFVHKQKKTQPVTKRLETCKIHCKLPLDMYCKTCSSSICRDCALHHHLGHVCDLVEKHDKERTKTLIQLRNRIGRHVKKSAKGNNHVVAQEEPVDRLLYVGKFDYVGIDDDDLSFKKGDLLYVTTNAGDWWFAEEKDSGREGHIPRNYVAKYKSLEAEDYYFGAIKRIDADKQLMQSLNGYGSFLVRESEKTPGEYSLAVRDTDRARHFKIHKLNDGRFYIQEDLQFDNVQDLVKCYSNDEYDGLCVKLKSSCLIAELPQPANDVREADQAMEVDRNLICLVKRLGTGQFGEIWEGMWTEDTPVAVKVQPDKANALEFVEEVAVLKHLTHVNVIQLLAVCTRDEPILIVTELMKHGSLLEYLRGDGCALTLSQQVDVATQVACGMAYLETLCVIHCDLAARNVLVSEQLVCKIANFGLAQFLSEDIYEAPSGTKFSPKWAAPEAAIYSHFSIKSDVWSFGILLYEVITFGTFPYPNMSNAQVMEALETGYRMPCPISCPERLYKIMRDCWREDAASRPTFETLQWRLEEYFIDDVEKT